MSNIVVRNGFMASFAVMFVAVLLETIDPLYDFALALGNVSALAVLFFGVVAAVRIGRTEDQTAA